MEDKQRPVRSVPVRYIWNAFGFTVMALAAIVFVPTWLPCAVRAYRARRNWLKRLRQQGRCIDLNTAETHAATGQCVLFVEVDYKGQLGDTWYVQASELADRATCPLPVLQRPIGRCLKALFDSETCHDWCSQHLPEFANRVRLVEMNPKHWREFDGNLGHSVRAVFFLEADIFRG